MGDDSGQFGADESIVLENDSTDPLVYYIVADSFLLFAACGTYHLHVEPA